LKGKMKNRFAGNKIGLKTIWITTSIITAAALILAHTFYLDSKEEIINQFNGEQLMLAKEASMKMEEFYTSLERTLKLTTGLAAESATEDARPPTLLNLENLYRPYRNTPLINIIVIDSGGNLLSAAGKSTIIEDASLREIRGKLESVPTGEIYTSPLLDITSTGEKGKKGFFIASTLNRRPGLLSLERSSPFGVAIIFSISLEGMVDKYIRPIKSGRNGHAWVMDNEGTLLFQARHPEMVFRNIFLKDKSCNHCHSDFFIEQKMASGQSGTGRSRVAGYEDNLIAYYPVHLGKMKWSIAVSAPYSEVSLAINRLMTKSGTLIGIITLMFLGSGVLTTRYVRAAIKAQEKARFLRQEMALKTKLEKTDMEVVRLAAAIESMDTFVMLTDLEGIIFYLNPSAETGLGYVLKESRSTRIDRLFGRTNPPHIFNIITTATSEGGWEGECVVLKRGGREIPVHLITSLVKDRDGRPISITWSIHDLTETKELQRKLIQHEKMRALWVLTAGVAHDFNNILAGILANTQILLRDLKSKKLDPSRFKQRLEVIQESTRRGGETVRRIELYTRKQEGSGMADLNILDIINQAIYTTQPHWISKTPGEGRPIIIETKLKPVPPVKGIHSELLEAMINIIINAVEAMPLGGKITITSKQAGETIVISITDTGEGMSKEAQEQVFDPFFTTKAPPSSGLGMSTASGVIQRHNGRIEVTSKKGAGTTFNIRLPASKDAGKYETTTKSASPGERTGILVIEEEVNRCNILCSLLSSRGYAVCCKNDAQSGLDKFRKKDFAVVLTELASSDLQGDSVARVIKKINPATPVIAVSNGLMGEEERAKLKRGEIDFLLTQPVASENLFNTVERALMEI